MDRVKRLLDDERRERVHAEALREREEWERAEREWEEREKVKREAERREQEESERQRQAQQRREAFRATVEDASESGGSEEGGHQSMGHEASTQPQGDAVMEELVREERAAFAGSEPREEEATDEEAQTRVSEMLSDFIVINVDDEPGQVSPQSRSQPEATEEEREQQRDEPVNAAPAPAPSFAPAREPSPPPTRPPPERSGLCVVCQDAESNIVIVDCGYALFSNGRAACILTRLVYRCYSHLALCRACADLIWSSSRECPLCRTRIVTEARLLRVFKS